MIFFNRLFNRKIIIFVHGLSNKPSRRLLKEWLKKSILEGFKNINVKKRRFNFSVAYWADLMYEKPQTLSEKDKNSDAFLDDPYVPGDPSKYKSFKPNKIKKAVLSKLSEIIDKISFEGSRFINIDAISNMLIRTLFQDLDQYYNKVFSTGAYTGKSVKSAIRERLSALLKKHRGKKIMLIAHSMGSIIAYDVLTLLTPDVKISSFVTIGSPLALPVIKKKVLEEQEKDNNNTQVLKSPENIDKWNNFSDLNDIIAANFDLANDYEKNLKGIGPEDAIVLNNYEFNGREDSHTSYGYLRAPEVTQTIYDFLTK